MQGIQRCAFRAEPLSRLAFIANKRWFSGLAAWTCWLCAVLPLAWSASTNAWSAPPEWEVMRIYIPSEPDQLSRIVTRDYRPILLEELSTELAEEEQRRKQSRFADAGLAEATYVARIDGEYLISERSRWRLIGEPQTLGLGRVSVALRNARGTGASQPQLLDDAGFSPQGHLEVALHSESQDRWFGFSASSISESSSRRFGLTLPPATSARMLIATPASMRLGSNSVVVDAIDAPTDHLPEDWEIDASLAANSTLQWWHVRLSGVSQFDLSLDQQPSKKLVGFKQLVSRTRLEYTLGTGEVETRAQFTLADFQPSDPLRLMVSKSLRVREVSFRGQPIAWNAHASLDGEQVIIELAGQSDPAAKAELEVVAYGALLGADMSVQLPEITVVDSFTIDGETRVRGEGQQACSQLEAAGARIERVPQLLGSQDGSDALTWRVGWMGSVPRTVAQLAKKHDRNLADSLTRFTVQEEWLSANCRIRINLAEVDANELRLPVGKSWFVDKAKLINPSSDIQLRLEERGDAESPIIALGWEGKLDVPQLELELAAHSPRETNSERISLRSPRLISVPGAVQTDHYVIEPSARFGVQMTTDLLAHQLQPSDLPVWQQQLLPQLTDKWILRGVQGRTPPVNLIAQSGTYAVDQSIVVREIEEAVQVDYRLECRPTFGAIDRLVVTIPEGFDRELFEWTYIESAEPASSGTPLMLSALSDTTHDAEQIAELELPGSMDGPFTVGAQVTVRPRSEQQLIIPVLGLPAASSSEASLILPRRLVHLVEAAAIEFMPASACCSDSRLAQLLDDQSFAEREALVVARFETASSHRLRMQFEQRQEPDGWVWQESIQHRSFDDGTQLHEIEWIVESLGLQAFRVKLPESWQVESATIDGESLDLDTDPPGTLSFDLPAFGQHTIRVTCQSRQASSKWLSWHPFKSPQVGMPVLDRSATLWVSPGRMPLTVLHQPVTGARLGDRLLPSNWWRWLAPHGPHLELSSDASRVVQHATTPWWTPINVTPGITHHWTSSHGAWTVDRSAASAITLAAIMALSAILWWLVGHAARLWWLLIAVTVVAVILAPLRWVPMAQMVLLSVLLAALLKLFAVVIRIPQTRRQSGKSGGSTLSNQTAPAEVLAPLLLCALINTAVGQDASTNPASRAIRSASADLDQPEIFGVLIPLDEDGQVAGTYAYAPTRLWELLTASTIASNGMHQPRILSADYTLRTRRSMVGQQDQFQELTAEFVIASTQSEAEIRLPFNAEEIDLLRGSANGQDLFVGGRSLYQDREAIVYRFSSPGTTRLSLQLEPLQLLDSDGGGGFRFAIPPIPTSSLRVVADAATRFRVLSPEGSHKSLNGSATELLGPVGLLDVRWSANASRNGASLAPASVSARSWIHARGSQLVAFCSLQIDNGRSLPKELHVTADPAWEPVGTVWGDANLIATESSSLGNRRIYTVRAAESVVENGALTITTVMVPRNSDLTTTVPIPFLALQEVIQPSMTKSFGWSTEQNAGWRADGVEVWQPIEGEVEDSWASLTVESPQWYQVPAGAMSNSLRRVTPRAPISVDEITQVRMHLAECRIQYRAQFGSLEKGVYSLAIPRSARVETLLLDGAAVPYEVSYRPEHAVLEIIPGTDQEFEVLELDLVESLELNHKRPLPRVVLRNVEVNSSIYRLLRSAAVRCQLESETELTLEPVTARPTELLSNLEVLVGQTDLRDLHRERPELPLQYTLTRNEATHAISSVIYFRRSRQGWTARLETVWQGGTNPPDYVFFDVPLALRDSLNAGQLPARFIPTGDSSRVTLCLIPPPPIDGRTRVGLEFEVQAATSSQSLNLPQITVLAEQPVRPVIALPVEVDSQPVRWLRTGRRLDESWENPVPTESPDKFNFYVFDYKQSQVNWRPQQTQRPSAEQVLTKVVVLSRAEHTAAGFVDFWIVPRGQQNLLVNVPAGCEVLGVEIGDSPAVWRQDADELDIVLQPNFLPLCVRLLARWEVPVNTNWRLQLPTTELAVDDSTPLIIEERLEGIQLADSALQGNNSEASERLLAVWSTLLSEAIAKTNSLSAEEAEVWLAQWHPLMVGLSVTSESAGNDLSTYDSESPEGLWLSLAAEVGLSEDRAGQIVDRMRQTKPAMWVGDLQRSRILGGATESVQFIAPQPTGFLLSRLIAAALLAAAGLLMLAIGSWSSSGYSRLLSSHPWIYWCQLAIGCWIVLPVIWPTWLLLLTASVMGINQLFDQRRRRRILAGA